MSVQSTAMPRCTRSLSASSFQRLTIRQKSCAVRSASYTAECASWLSKSSPAAIAAGLDFDSHEAHSAVYDAERTAQLFCLIVNRWKELADNERVHRGMAVD